MLDYIKQEIDKLPQEKRNDQRQIKKIINKAIKRERKPRMSQSTIDFFGMMSICILGFALLVGCFIIASNFKEIPIYSIQYTLPTGEVKFYHAAQVSSEDGTWSFYDMDAKEYISISGSVQSKYLGTKLAREVFE